MRRSMKMIEVLAFAAFSIPAAANADISGKLYLNINSNKLPADTYKVTLTCLDCPSATPKADAEKITVPTEDNGSISIYIGSSIPENGHIATFSDLQGRFFFKDINPGHYKIEVLTDNSVVYSNSITINKEGKKNLGEILVKTLYKSQRSKP